MNVITDSMTEKEYVLLSKIRDGEQGVTIPINKETTRLLSDEIHRQHNVISELNDALDSTPTVDNSSLLKVIEMLFANFDMRQKSPMWKIKND